MRRADRLRVVFTQPMQTPFAGGSAHHPRLAPANARCGRADCSSSTRGAGQIAISLPERGGAVIFHSPVARQVTCNAARWHRPCESLYETVALRPATPVAHQPGGDPFLVHHPPSPFVMLSYALLFFIIAIIAAALGFGGLAGASATVAKVLFVVFLILFLISLVSGRRPRP